MERRTIPETTWLERARILAFFALALMVAALIGVFWATPAHAATFTVNTDADPQTPTTTGCDATECTLREAITAANNTPNSGDPDLIHFNISGSGVKTIQVDGTSDPGTGTDLPIITEAVTIDGYTQPGASPNTKDLPAKGTDANLLIVVNGGSITSSNGLIRINASDVEVKGLVLRCYNTGISIQSGGSHAVIQGNFIGNNAAECTVNTGVNVFGGGANTIGGEEPAARNLISGNSVSGISIADNGGNTIQGNLIGTRANGTDPLGNTEGVEIASPNNTVGNGTGDNELGANLIAFNGFNGVLVKGVSGFSAGNRILSNSIHSNGLLGIDLTATGVFSPDGVTHNDRRDRDTGGNNLQNFPVITSATRDSTTGTTTIKGTLKSTPRKNFTIQFFTSSEPDPSGFGEGEQLLYQLDDVKTNRRGSRSFKFQLTGVSAGEFLTATATRLVPDPNDPATLVPTDTSEFSEAKEVTQAP